jgi:hypothetical protein
LFNTGYGDDAKGIDDTDVNQFNLADADMFDYLNYIFGTANSLLSAGVIVGVALTASILTKNYVYLGVGIFTGLVTSMYSGFMSIISQLGSAVTSDNVYVTGIITIVGIAVGLIVMFNVVDMFAPHPT